MPEEGMRIMLVKLRKEGNESLILMLAPSGVLSK
jgi:hypothetical protein